jgi:hypothetical protein
MKTSIGFVIAVLACSLSTSLPAATINNDDSCDIAVLPAATLLLPLFEVDLNAPQSVARTTLFTVVNTSKNQQIARATMWTDLGYPLMSFNLSLTGYDVEPVNLYDIIARGTLPPANCLVQPPNPIPPHTLADIRTALTTGVISSCAGRVGLIHPNAIGYLTIDLAAACGVTMPTDSGYFNELLYDNVLTGDYETIDPNPATGNFAGGTPLVHIRAVPEGGAAGAIVKTNLPYTFYDRYTPQGSNDSRAMDRRQPLPSLFTARYISGGLGSFNTNLRIWREGVVPPDAPCADYTNNGTSTAMKVTDEVRFDEHENASMMGISERPLPPLILPVASNLPTSSGLFPPLSTSGDVGGWLYLNLSNGGSTVYSVKNERTFGGSTVRPSQNWVVTSMSAEGRYQTSFDATMLSNGCSPVPAAGALIGPGPNPNP